MGRRRATPPATRSSLAVSLARLRLRRPMRFGVDHVGAGAGVGTEAGAAGAGAGAGARLASLRSVHSVAPSPGRNYSLYESTI